MFPVLRSYSVQSLNRDFDIHKEFLSTFINDPSFTVGGYYQMGVCRGPSEETAGDFDVFFSYAANKWVTAQLCDYTRCLQLLPY